ncbi:hypothetical protein G9A89_008082 [Geosiphon pyriformis]|nr:hypothetical protein G9A89_008082 [Geosiphon pyriformis]
MVFFCLPILSLICFSTKYCKAQNYEPSPRSSHSATLIQDRIYYFGGQIANDQYDDKDFFYLDLPLSFQSNRVSFVNYSKFETNITIPSIYKPTNVLGGEMGNRIYLFGGYVKNDSIFLNDQVYTIDVVDKQSSWSVIVNDTLTNIDTWPSGRESLAAVIDKQGRMYIWGGWGITDKTIYIFDTKTNIWKKNLPEDAPNSRAAYTATILNDGRIIYIGGIISSTYVQADIQEMAPIQPNNPRSSHSAILAPDGHNIIIYGGENIDIETSLLVLNTDLFTWSYPLISNQGPDYIPNTHTANLYKNYMIISFGTRRGKPSSDIDILDISNLNNVTWIARNSKFFNIQYGIASYNSTDSNTYQNSTNNVSSNDTFQNDKNSNPAIIIGSIVGGVVVIADDSNDYYPPPRIAHSATIIGDRLYYFGGQKSDNIYYNDLSYLDLNKTLTQNKLFFVSVSSLSTTIPGIFKPASVAIGSNKKTILFFGGYVRPINSDSDPVLSNQIYSINLENDLKPTWAVTGSNSSALPSPRENVPSIINDKGQMYIWGGWGITDKAMYILDTNKLTWQKSTPANAPDTRSFSPGVLLPDGRIIFIGGYDGNYMASDSQQLLIYNTITDEWKQEGTINIAPANPIHKHTAVLAPDKQHIIIYGQISNKTSVTVLDTNTFLWSVPTMNQGPLYIPDGHSATMYKNYMIISFGIRLNPSSEVSIADVSDPKNINWLKLDGTLPLNSSSNSTSSKTLNSAPTSSSNKGSDQINNTSTTTTDGKSNQKAVILGIIGVVVGLGIMSLFVTLYFRKRRLKKLQGNSENLPEVVNLRQDLNENLSEVVN